MSAVIQICIGCKDRDPARRRRGEGGGRELAEAMRDLAAALSADGKTPISVATFPCLGRCARKGRMALSGEGRWSWSFEAIDPEMDRAALTAFIAAWFDSADGFVPKDRRPPSLRKKMLGRVPPPAMRAG